MTKVILIDRQRGTSLLEILVSLSIGLILLMVLASLMVVASNSSKQRSTSELLDETARQVFSRLETDLYRSGKDSAGGWRKLGGLSRLYRKHQGLYQYGASSKHQGPYDA